MPLLRADPEDRLVRFPGVRDAIDEQIRIISKENEDAMSNEDVPTALPQEQPATSITGSNRPLSAERLLEHLLQAAIARFGYAPRDVFRAVLGFNNYTTEVARTFNVMQKFVMDMASMDISNPSMNHRIFAIGASLFSGSYGACDLESGF
jgi:hypothetical protein